MQNTFKYLKGSWSRDVCSTEDITDWFKCTYIYRLYIYVYVYIGYIYMYMYMYMYIQAYMLKAIGGTGYDGWTSDVQSLNSSLLRAH